MKRRKRKKRRRWPKKVEARPNGIRSVQVVAKKLERRQIILQGARMPMGRQPRLVDAKSCHNSAMAELAGRPARGSSEPSSENALKFPSHSSPATRVVHFASTRPTNKQFMRSLWLLSCLLAANSLPHLQQRTAASVEISAPRADESPTSLNSTLGSARAETSVRQLHDDADTSQSVFVPLAPINEQRRQTRAAANATTTALQDQDQRATDPLDMANLPAGSRLVVAREGRQVELACDARESIGGEDNALTTRNEREFIISGANKTVQRLDPTDDRHRAARLKDTQHSDHDDLDADQLTDRLVSLVFWYKNDDPAPIYTLDARPSASKLGLAGSPGTGAGNANVRRLVSLNKQLLGAAKHYERNRTGGDEVHHPQSRIQIDEWPVIKLQLNDLRGHHTGDYKCRVDFRRARTIRRVVRLLVEVPLQSLSLRASDNNYTSPEDGGDISLVQSSKSDETTQDQNHTQIVRVNQDQRVEFECRTNAGARPRPILSWLVSWPASNALSATSTGEEFFASPDSQARLARLLNGSIEAGPSRDGHHGRQLASNRKLSDDFGSSKLILNRLGRSMLGLRVGCRARQARLALDETADARRLRPQPANHAQPVSQGADSTAAALESTKWLELELNLRPESVAISRLEQQTPPRNKQTGPEVGVGGEPAPGEKVEKVSLDEREPITLVCRSRGARPPARLSWSWLGDGDGGNDLEPVGRPTAKTGEAFGGGGPKIIDKTNGEAEGESASQLEFPHGLAGQWHGRKLLCAATNEATTSDRLGGTPPSAHLELDIRSRQLINKTNGGGSDQAEIKQVAGAVRKHNKLFRLESATRASETPPGDDDELATEREPSKKMASSGGDSGESVDSNGRASSFVTIDELGEDSGHEQVEPMAELKCAAANAVGEQASAPIVWTPSEPAELVKCRTDERLAALRKSQSTWGAPDDSLLSQIEVHGLARDGWPSRDKFSCELDRAKLNATRYAWSFVPIELVPERAGQWAGKWPLGVAGHSEVFSQSSELTGAAEKLQISARPSAHRRGLLLCKVQLAGSQEWWPRSGPCLTLVSSARASDVPSSEFGQHSAPASSLAAPSAESCRIEPILVPGRASAKSDEKDLGDDDTKQTTHDRLAISVDCSAAPGKEALIFELGVARRPPATGRADVGPSQTRGDAILHLQEQPAGRALDDLMLLDEQSGAPRKNKTGRRQQRAKKLLFTEHTTTGGGGGVGGYRRLALSDLIPLSQDFVSPPAPRQSGGDSTGREDEPAKWKENERDAKLDDAWRVNKLATGAQESDSVPARKLHQGGGESAPHSASEMNSSSSTAASLNEQVQLLNELVFTLRASDLVRVSEPRAIYGSELRLAKRTPAPGAAAPALPANARRTKSSQRGSGESASSSAASLSRSAELLQLLGSEQTPAATARDVEGRGWENVTKLARPTRVDLVEWGRQHEVGITMAAIGATVVLSALTLTLIVLVLRRSRRNSSSSAMSANKSPAAASGHRRQQSELVLVRSGSRVSLASRQNQQQQRAAESPLSSECQNSRALNDSLHSSKADPNQRDRGYLTSGKFATASLAGSQVCLSSQVDFLAPPVHQLRQQGQLSSASSSSCATSYTLTNSTKRPPRQVRLNLSPQSIGPDHEDAQTIVEHNDSYRHLLGSLPRGNHLNWDTRNLLTLPADLQVAHAPFCSQHQQSQLIFEHQMATADCSFEQSAGSLMSLSDQATGSLSAGGHRQTCHSHLILAPANQLAFDMHAQDD